MEKKLPLFFLLLAVLFYWPHLQAQISPVPPGRSKPSANTAPFQKGVVLIKVARKFESGLPGGKSTIAAFSIAALDGVLQKLKVKSIRQEFAVILDPAVNEQSAKNANRALAAKGQPLVSAAILDQRHREFGFHLWYRLTFDSAVFLRGVMDRLQSLKGIVDVAEPVPQLSLAAFNDPLYPYQYSLHNTGQGGGRAGADIKVEQAWNITTGDTSVVVAITDTGIKTDHEDLDTSMWAGTGYNFFDDSPVIVPGHHGTHVAGIVAARSNNGTGISGIAGGNGTRNSGVRVMSTAIFNSAGNAEIGEYAAFIYAADNGAAINNNSWAAYSSIYHREFSFIDAVRYFSQYGGGAAVKGGITVWAAANENFSVPTAVNSYDVNNNIVVAATDRNDKKAGYSNYGDHVSISAPGTDIVSSINYSGGSNPYASFYGTSMAAPAVSGVAALVASVAPGRFTADEVTSIVLSTADNIDSLNPGYEGKLGSGRVNAYKAVLKAQQMAAQPLLDTVSNVSAARTCNGYTVSYSKNAANNDVMIALGLSRTFDLPNGRVYNAGDSIGKAAKVVYRGPAASVAVNGILRDSAIHYVKLWSVSGTNYSGGTVVAADTSFYTLRNPTATQGVGSVAIQFDKGCVNSDVMVVVNSLPQFGHPSGTLNSGANIPGGGTVVYKGSAAGYTHNGLTSGSYYYSLYPVIGNQYGMARYLGGFCFGITGLPLPLKTSFETPDVPENFAVFTPNPYNLGWEVANGVHGLTGQGYLHADNGLNYNVSNLGETSLLQTAPLGVTAADSVICKFAHALALYDRNILLSIGLDADAYQDTLAVMVSADCGKTWQTAWKKWGFDLKSMEPTNGVLTLPSSQQDWALNKVNLTGFIPTGTSSIMVAFKVTNRGGTGLFLDDVNIYRVQQRDAGIASILYPGKDACSATFAPKVVLSNYGVGALTSVTVRYHIDNGAVQSYNWTGNKLYEQSDTLMLPVVTATAGNHTLTVYTALPNGQSDEILTNDTTVVAFRVLQPMVLAPNSRKTESFEDPAFVPDQWRLDAPDKPFNWVRVDASLLPAFVAAAGAGAAAVNTYDNPAVGEQLDLHSPAYNTGNADTVKLTFSRAAADYTGNGATTDKLEVLLTTDCGQTFTTVYSKTGAALTTSPVINWFYPTSLAEWKSDTVDVSGLVRNAGAYRFLFRVTNSFNNNVFLDDVQVHSKTAGVVLPLNLLTFAGKAAGSNSAFLTWRTVNEVNTAYFELQRSTDAITFKPVSRIGARGSAQTSADYGYTDANLLPGYYYYRLRMVDKDGKQTFSQQVSVTVKNGEAITVYPVPAVDVVMINSGVSLMGKNVILTDVQGRVLKVIKITQPQQPLNTSALAAGTYLLKLPDSTTVKVIKM